MKPILDQHIGEIVAANYLNAGVFHKYGIDFCCGGGVSLAHACAKHNLSTETIIGELDLIARQSEKADDYQEWSADKLIDHIVSTHHTYVKSKLQEITDYAVKVARVHGERHPENIVIRDSFIALADEMRSHMLDEETVVFPMIRSGSTEYRNHLAELEAEHEAAGSLMATIREASNGFTPPEDACATYRILYLNLKEFEADLHKHVHLENNILFKK
jgi:regulator of cell morphogenesis and NO signaling